MLGNPNQLGQVVVLQLKSLGHSRKECRWNREYSQKEFPRQDWVILVILM